RLTRCAAGVSHTASSGFRSDLLQHSIECQPGKALLWLGHDDLVVDLPLDQTFERPQQMIRRYTEHRRAEASERIECLDVDVGRDLARQTVDEMNLGADRPHTALRAVLHR